MNVGDKVKAKYTDAVGSKIVWDGHIKEIRTEGDVVDVVVDLGGIAIVFKPEEIIHGEVGEKVDQAGS